MSRKGLTTGSVSMEEGKTLNGFAVGPRCHSGRSIVQWKPQIRLMLSFGEDYRLALRDAQAENVLGIFAHVRGIPVSPLRQDRESIGVVPVDEL